MQSKVDLLRIATNPQTAPELKEIARGMACQVDEKLAALQK